MKNIRIFYLNIFLFLVGKLLILLNRHVFVMFYCIKVGFKGVKIILVCFRDECFIFKQINLLSVYMSKNAGLVVNSVDSDHMPRSVASDLGLHRLLILVCLNS